MSPSKEGGRVDGGEGYGSQWSGAALPWGSGTGSRLHLYFAVVVTDFPWDVWEVGLTLRDVVCDKEFQSSDASCS